MVFTGVRRRIRWRIAFACNEPEINNTPVRLWHCGRRRWSLDIVQARGSKVRKLLQRARHYGSSLVEHVLREFARNLSRIGAF